MTGTQLDAALSPGEIVEVLESDYAWAHKIVGRRGLVIDKIVPRDIAPGEILIEGERFSLYCTEVKRLTDG